MKKDKIYINDLLITLGLRNKSIDDLFLLFQEDNTLFKRFLKVYFHEIICNYFEFKVSFDYNVEELIPIDRRIAISEDFLLKTNLLFPRMYFSKFQIRSIASLSVIPFILIIFLGITSPRFLFSPFLGLGISGGITIYLFFFTIPVLVCRLFFPKIFLKAYLPEVISYEDFLNVVVVTNWFSYYDGKFKRLLDELSDYNP